MCGCAGKLAVHLSDELLGQEVFQVRPKVPRIQDQLLLQLALHGYIVHGYIVRRVPGGRQHTWKNISHWTRGTKVG